MEATPMTLRELQLELSNLIKNGKGDFPIYFDFCNLYPLYPRCWSGDANKPALFINQKSEWIQPTADSLLEDIDDIIEFGCENKHGEMTFFDLSSEINIDILINEKIESSHTVVSGIMEWGGMIILETMFWA